tara:strand:- start:857 stop:1426 length:570 start_codon:yes stop_codon:yes gene_type:complete
MKLTFETTKYYKKNKRISKTQGILFMALGFIVLGFVVYWTFQFSINANAMYEDWNSDDYSSDYGYYDDVDCSAGSSVTNKMNLASSSFNTKKSEYESVKSKYYSTSNVDLQLEYHEQWGESYNSLISVFNDIIFTYNEDPLYFDNCYNYSVSNDIETKRSYLDSEEIVIDTEFQKLKQRAEAEGYIFYE